jgi:hypothetical protein
LITIYVWLRSATTILTVFSAWGMRRKHPELRRSFVVPGGKIGLFYVIAAPVVMSFIALFGSDAFAMRWGPVAIVLGPVAYGVDRLFRRNRSAGSATATS